MSTIHSAVQIEKKAIVNLVDNHSVNTSFGGLRA